MKDFLDFGSIQYDTDTKQWESSLKSELKLDAIEARLKKQSLDIGQFPILSVSTKGSSSLPSYSSWKKASQTYILFKNDSIKKQLQDDLENGVRVFFFYGPFLKKDNWEIVQKTLESFDKCDEVEVFILDGKVDNISSKLNILQRDSFLMTNSVAQGGGHNIHELGVLICHLVESGSSLPRFIGVHVDSNFFKNIAKIRALRLLVMKVLQELNIGQEIQIVALNSYADWTLYERYSNILRNALQVSSSLMAGADVVQSSGYQSIFYLETEDSFTEHDANSYRIARNSSHVLALESMLGIVEDAAYGSYHLESLTHVYAEEAWQFMQKILPMTLESRKTFISNEVAKVHHERVNFLKKRKKIISGINDFPDAKEKLNSILKDGSWSRPSRLFEELRLKVEKLPLKKEVKILISGQLSELNSRISFIRNYFELLGLNVSETTDLNSFTSQDVIILCAKDDDYKDLIPRIDPTHAFAAYIAGRVGYPGFLSLYSGQDVYEELNKLVQKFMECQ